MMRNEEDGIRLNAGQRRRVLLAVALIVTGRIILIAGLAALSLFLPPVPFCVAPFCVVVILAVASAQRMREAKRQGWKWVPEMGTEAGREDIRRMRRENAGRTVIMPGAGRKGRTAVCVRTKAGRIIV